MALGNREAAHPAADPLMNNDDSGGLVDRIIERTLGNRDHFEEQQAPVTGLVVARIAAFQGIVPQLLMEIGGELHYSTAIAVTGDLDPEKDIGATVCVAFDRNDVRRPVVLGKIVSGTMDRVTGNSGGIEITHDTEIVLRCGKASIRLKSDGTVAIRGTNVASRASETNRIRGGNVQIN